MAYNREEVINYAPGGDSVKTGIEKLDTDLTGAFTHLNTIDTDLTNHAADTSTHGVTTVAGISETQTLTNKTISLANNTVSGTLAQFNAAVSDADFLDTAAAASTYAPIAKGVTNGDTHDHSGGDGGTIAYSSLSGTPTMLPPPDGDKGDITVSGSGATWTINDNVVTPAKMSRTGTAGQVLVSGGADDDPYYLDQNSLSVGSATNATNADNAANVPWTGVTGRPTSLSSFSNDTGFITSSELPAGGGALGFRNKIINGGAQVAQRGAIAIVVNTRQYGGADRIQGYVAASTVTGGTWKQISYPTSTTGYAQTAYGINATGATAVQFNQKIEAQNCVELNGSPVTISVGLWHDSGLSVNGNIQLLKANSVDNFTSTTSIATSSNTAIPNTTYTKLTFTTTLGAADANNGLQVNVTFVFGSATLSNKSFLISEFQLEKGTTATPFEARPVGLELALCQRYYERGVYSYGGSAWADRAVFAQWVPFKVTKRATPTVSTSGTVLTNVDSFLADNTTADGYRAVVTPSAQGGWAANGSITEIAIEL